MWGPDDTLRGRHSDRMFIPASRVPSVSSLMRAGWLRERGGLPGREAAGGDFLGFEPARRPRVRTGREAFLLRPSIQSSSTTLKNG